MKRIGDLLPGFQRSTTSAERGVDPRTRKEAIAFAVLAYEFLARRPRIFHPRDELRHPSLLGFETSPLRIARRADIIQNAVSFSESVPDVSSDC